MWFIFTPLWIWMMTLWTYYLLFGLFTEDAKQARSEQPLSWQREIAVFLMFPFLYPVAAYLSIKGKL